MATYYPNSTNNQREVVPTLYLRDPAPELSPANMMMYMNYSSSTGSYSDALAGNSVELPSVGASELNPSQQGILGSFSVSHAGDQGFSGWRDGRNEMLFMQPTSGSMTIQSIGAADDLVHRSVAESSQMSLQTQLGILHGGTSLQGQGLSLSLSTQIQPAVPVTSFEFRHPNPGFTSFLTNPTISGEGGSGNGSCRDDESSPSRHSRNSDYLQPSFAGGNHEAMKREGLNNLQASVNAKQMHSDPSPCAYPGLASTIPNSKYLKAAQQLLDEVVNVQKALKQHKAGKGSAETDKGSKDMSTLPPSTGMSSNTQDSTSNSASELSPAERQELQNKVTKLLSMLDEVDRRYRQYYHQMQIVVSSFDVIAGCGAAKPYTALALETISRHFRCLRDAINDQITATRRTLGEQDAGGNKGGGISRLRFVDQHIRQQRALQQLGMMQQHAWRPQRGLPESSVSVLRAWLFEHFLHPYPKDSDKIMLARQTGLTRSQVSNWFINARVRLWKPMVEEMYKEEFGDAEMDSNSSSENASKAAKNDSKVSDDRREESQQNSKPANSDVEMSGSMTGTSFQNAAHGEDDMDYVGMKLRADQRVNVDDSSLLQDAFVQSDGSSSAKFMTADAAYQQMAELGRFGNGGGVSLTLGLQHCNTGGLSMSGGNHHSFIPMRGDEMYTAATSLGPDTTDYDCIDPGNRSRRFNSSHMLHDFVA
ncbi:hypothetical protein Syun_005145 [Stephania yunnanensis]|uniref:Homeobox domain-containing protein n=1 Tax=Stephania yunnanensis TaxID=152371 RepID=A0AAP0Q1Y7_9MAGN